MVPSECSAVLGIVTSGLWVSVLCLENGYQDMACLVPITHTTDRFGTGLAHQRHSGCLWEPLRLGELAELPAHLAAARPGSREGMEPRPCPATDAGFFTPGCQAPDGCWVPSQGQHLPHPRGTSMRHLACGGGSSPPSPGCLPAWGWRGAGSPGRCVHFTD